MGKNSIKYFDLPSGRQDCDLSRYEIDKVIAYIENQKEHHKKKTFQDEYRAFLKKYKVEYDERFIWD